MKKASAKLHSESGASIILALVFLLICLGVGAMVLASASVNIHKETGARERQEEYLSISSAARLIKAAYGNSSCTISESFTDYTCGIDADVTAPAVRDTTNKLTSAACDVFRASAQFDNSGSGFAGETFTVKPDGTHGGDMKDVSVSFSMDDNYNAKFVLTCEGDATNAYAMTLTFRAVAEKNSAAASMECSHQETDAKGSKYDVAYPYTVTTNTASVKWDAGEITKGAAE
jgi:hypothetical protein